MVELALLCCNRRPHQKRFISMNKTQWTLGVGARIDGLEVAVAKPKCRTPQRVPLQWATTQNNLGAALWRLGERESGTARLEEAVAAFRAALEERTRERVPLDWAMTQMNLGSALQRLGAGERDGAARGGGRGLPRGAGGTDARTGAARLGDDADESRHRALDARGAGERDGAPRGAGGTDARAGSARLGDDADQPRQCARRLGCWSGIVTTMADFPAARWIGRLCRNCSSMCRPDGLTSSSSIRSIG